MNDHANTGIQRESRMIHDARGKGRGALFGAFARR